MGKLLPFLCICAATVAYSAVLTWRERRRLRACGTEYAANAKVDAYTRYVLRRLEAREITPGQARDFLDHHENRER